MKMIGRISMVEIDSDEKVYYLSGTPGREPMFMCAMYDYIGIQIPLLTDLDWIWYIKWISIPDYTVASDPMNFTPSPLKKGRERVDVWAAYRSDRDLEDNVLDFADEIISNVRLYTHVLLDKPDRQTGEVITFNGDGKNYYI